MLVCEICKIKTENPVSIVIAFTGGARSFNLVCEHCGRAIEAFVNSLIENDTKQSDAPDD